MVAPNGTVVLNQRRDAVQLQGGFQYVQAGAGGQVTPSQVILVSRAVQCC